MSRWPRTAAMLRSMSQHYEPYARHEDLSSELRDLKWHRIRPGPRGMSVDAHRVGTV